MNTNCVSLIVKDDVCVNCFKSYSYKLFTDVSSINEIELKFGYTLNITFISTTYITIEFQSLNTSCSFNLPYNLETTYSLPVEGGTYCVNLTASCAICTVSCCGG